MILAVEVIYTQGQPVVKAKADGWTIETADGSLAALFEDTVAVTKKSPLVLTRG
jgi:methionyl aminopeptidase